MKNCFNAAAEIIENLQNYSIGEIVRNLDESVYVYLNENNKIYIKDMIFNLKNKKISKA
jgi:hypothetical protein